MALAANLLALFAMVLVMRPSFETNDDIVFAELGSGLRGVKDAPGISELRAGCDLPVSVRSDRQTAVVHDFSVCDSSGGIYCSDLCINKQAGRNFRPVSFSDPCMWIWL